MSRVPVVTSITVLLAISLVAAGALPQIWTQTFLGLNPPTGQKAGVFLDKYYVVVEDRYDNLFSQFFWMTVLDVTSGDKVLDVQLSTAQGPTFAPPEIKALEVFENEWACVATNTGRVMCVDVPTKQFKVNATVESCNNPNGPGFHGVNLVLLQEHKVIGISCMETIATISYETGKIEFNATAQYMEFVVSPVGIHGTSGYVLTRAPRLDAYDLVTGKKKWSFETFFDSIVCMTNNVVVVSSSFKNVLMGFDAATGKPLWTEHATGLGGLKGFCPAAGRMVLTTMTKENIHHFVVARDIMTGSVLYTLSGTQADSLVLDPASSLLIGVHCTYETSGPSKTGLKGFNASTGALLWGIETPLAICPDKSYELTPGAAISSKSPVTVLTSGELVVPNIIGMNFFSRTTGERQTSAGREALQFGMLGIAIDSAVVFKDMLITYTGTSPFGISPSNTITVQAFDMRHL